LSLLEKQPTRHLTPDWLTCLFAALNTATGQVTDACYPRHRHQEFLRLLKKVAAVSKLVGVGCGCHCAFDTSSFTEADGCR
jgi:hypothetical protein